MVFGLFLTLGVAVLSIALRTYQNSYAQKAGALGILVATFLAIYFITSNWVLGIAAAMSWLFLPWLEILTRIRALRLGLSWRVLDRLDGQNVLDVDFSQGLGGTDEGDLLKSRAGAKGVFNKLTFDFER